MNEITPAARFKRNLEDGRLIGDVFTMDDYRRAFHRTVVDHYASLHLEPIEGFHVAAQAEIVCNELTTVKALSF